MPQFADSALQALDALNGTNPADVDSNPSPGTLGAAKDAASVARKVWFDLFRVYGTRQSRTRCSAPGALRAQRTTEAAALRAAGTHFVTELTLGGKIIYTRYVKHGAISNSSEGNGVPFDEKMRVSGARPSHHHAHTHTHTPRSSAQCVRLRPVHH